MEIPDIKQGVANSEEADVNSEALPWVRNHPEKQGQEKRVGGARMGDWKTYTLGLLCSRLAVGSPNRNLRH